MIRWAVALSLASVIGCAGDVQGDETPADEANGSLVAFTCDTPSITEERDDPRSAEVAAVRTAGHEGYDRFVLQFRGGLPSYTVRKRLTPSFPTTSGKPVVLSGITGLEVIVNPANAHDDRGRASFSGPRSFHPSGTTVLLEVAQIEDFEGTVTWGLGLSRASCFRTFELDGPPRVIVDVKR